MYIRDCSCMYSYFIALITNLLSTSFFYYNNTSCRVCSESFMEAACNRCGECTFISGSMIDINTVIY